MPSIVAKIKIPFEALGVPAGMPAETVKEYFENSPGFGTMLEGMKAAGASVELAVE